MRDRGPLSWLALGAGLLIAMSACNGALHGSRAPKYQVHVSALRDPAATDRGSFVLVPGVEGVSPHDLQYREYARMVRRVLASRGFTEEATPRNAQLAVFVAYGLGGPALSYAGITSPALGLVPSTAAPEGQTPTASLATDLVPGAFGFYMQAHTAATHVGNSAMQAANSAAQASSQAANAAAQASSQAAMLSSRHYYNGTQRELPPQHQRFLELSAIDLPSYLTGSGIRELWRVTVTSQGSTSDLRVVIPVLAAASRNAIATDSGRSESQWIRGDDPRVAHIRGDRETPR